MPQPYLTLTALLLYLSSCSNAQFSQSSTKTPPSDQTGCGSPALPCKDRSLGPISSNNDVFATPTSPGSSLLKSQLSFLREGDQILKGGLVAGEHSSDFSSIEFSSGALTPGAESSFSSELVIKFAYEFSNAVTLYKNQKIFVEGKSKSGASFSLNLSLDILLKKSTDAAKAPATLVCDKTAGVKAGNCASVKS